MTDINKITEQMSSYVCDHLCKYRDRAASQEEIDVICEECQMGHFVQKLTDKDKNMGKLTDQKIDSAYLYAVQLRATTEPEQENIENIVRCIEELAECKVKQKKIKKIIDEYKENRL